jgi:hypothetical protein
MRQAPTAEPAVSSVCPRCVRRTAPNTISAGQSVCGDESACTPDSVPGLAAHRWPSISAGDCPPAPAAYPGSNGRTTLPLLGLAPDGVYRAIRVAPDAGALLPHRFTLTCAPGPRARCHRRSALCCTVLRVTPTGCYPAPCPVESGRSSDGSPLLRAGPHAAIRPTRHRQPFNHADRRRAPGARRTAADGRPRARGTRRPRPSPGTGCRC